MAESNQVEIDKQRIPWEQISLPLLFAISEIWYTGQFSFSFLFSPFYSLIKAPALLPSVSLSLICVCVRYFLGDRSQAHNFLSRTAYYWIETYKNNMAENPISGSSFFFYSICFSLLISSKYSNCLCSY